MFLLMFCAIIIASGSGTQIEEVENCDRSQLKVCVALVPRTRIGLPRNKKELDAHCGAYNTGMSCMDTWIQRCLPTDVQIIFEKQIKGARAVMHYLCNETSFRNEYLKQPQCWDRVSPHWSHCVDELNYAIKEITGESSELTYYIKSPELCCARDDFLICVEDAGRMCSNTASSLLKRMAMVLAQDVVDCSQQPRAHCTASSPPIVAPLLGALYGIIFYPPHF